MHTYTILSPICVHAGRWDKPAGERRQCIAEKFCSAIDDESKHLRLIELFYQAAIRSTCVSSSLLPESVRTRFKEVAEKTTFDFCCQGRLSSVIPMSSATPDTSCDRSLKAKSAYTAEASNVRHACVLRQRRIAHAFAQNISFRLRCKQ